MSEEERISWRAFMSCTDTKTPHKLSGQSQVGWARLCAHGQLNKNESICIFYRHFTF